MKQVILSFALILFSMAAICQKKSDTLIVDTQKYSYIKIKDKVYHIEYSLTEVKPDPPKRSLLWEGSTFTFDSSANNYLTLPYSTTTPNHVQTLEYKPITLDLFSNKNNQ